MMFKLKNICNLGEYMEIKQKKENKINLRK